MSIECSAIQAVEARTRSCTGPRRHHRDAIRPGCRFRSSTASKGECGETARSWEVPLAVGPLSCSPVRRRRARARPGRFQGNRYRTHRLRRDSCAARHPGEQMTNRRGIRLRLVEDVQSCTELGSTCRQDRRSGRSARCHRMESQRFVLDESGRQQLQPPRRRRHAWCREPAPIWKAAPCKEACAQSCERAMGHRD